MAVRIAFIGRDRWLAAGLGLVFIERPTWEYATHTDARSLAAVADVLILHRARDAAAAQPLVPPSTAGRVVVVIADDPGERVDGVFVTDRAEGPQAVLTLLDEISLGVALPARCGARAGRVRLSTQEQRVLALTAGGATAPQVARQLGITAGTVAAYLRRIRSKYAMAGRPAPRKLDLFHRAMEDGIVPPPPRPR
jgi:DNA-binding CsgD family transcriptional regulator